MDALEQDAQKLNNLLTQLLKCYQYRDRSQICCFGLSVSQCHTLATIIDDGPLAMRELAAKLYLTISTMTRIVDQLVKKNLVHRREGDQDRRQVWVEATPEGKEVIKKIQDAMLTTQKTILSQLSLQEREGVIKALTELCRAAQVWLCQCKA